MNLFTVCLIQAILHLKISLFITLFSLSSFSHLFGFSITSSILNRGHVTASFRYIHLYYYTSTLKLQCSMYNY